MIEPYKISITDKYVILNQVKTFGVISNTDTLTPHENKKKKCKLCRTNFAIPSFENVLTNENTAVDCCLSCVLQLHKVFQSKSNNVTLS